MLRLLATNEEDDIALGRVDVCILQQKHAVYTVFLKHGKLDEQANWTCQLLADDEVLLAPGLHTALEEAWGWSSIGTHAFEQGEQVSAGLVTAVICISQGRHHARGKKERRKSGSGSGRQKKFAKNKRRSLGRFWFSAWLSHCCKISVYRCCHSIATSPP
jgi:hypothetical protein